MNLNRFNAAFTVFEGKIVVSGGYREESIPAPIVGNTRRGISRMRLCNLKSVVAFDYYENKWISFPSMLSPRRNHTSISIGNKMFMVGGYTTSSYKDLNTFEVFDSVTRMFTTIENIPKWIDNLNPNKIVCGGYYIYFFVAEENIEMKVHSYDVKKNLFSFVTSSNQQYTRSFSCTKVSMF